MSIGGEARLQDPFPARAHDHAACVDRALSRAEAVCARHGVRLTEVRRDVLALVWESHAPIGAYEILERLARRRGRSAPPTVYRALDFLVAHHLVHRIDSKNAFIGCAAASESHHACFLICKECGNAAEIVDSRLDRTLHDCARHAGFRLEAVSMELHGLCSTCAADRPNG